MRCTKTVEIIYTVDDIRKLIVEDVQNQVDMSVDPKSISFIIAHGDGSVEPKFAGVEITASE